MRALALFLALVLALSAAHKRPIGWPLQPGVWPGFRVRSPRC